MTFDWSVTCHPICSAASLQCRACGGNPVRRVHASCLTLFMSSTNSGSMSLPPATLTTPTMNPHQALQGRARLSHACGDIGHGVPSKLPAAVGVPPNVNPVETQFVLVFFEALGRDFSAVKEVTAGAHRNASRTATTPDRPKPHHHAVTHRSTDLACLNHRARQPDNARIAGSRGATRTGATQAEPFGRVSLGRDVGPTAWPSDASIFHLGLGTQHDLRCGQYVTCRTRRANSSTLSLPRTSRGRLLSTLLSQDL